MADRKRKRRDKSVDQNGTRLRRFDLVRTATGHLSAAVQSKYPFANGSVLLFLGELNQMPGHCAVVDKAGRTWWGYHTENFVRVTDDDA